MKNMSKVKLLTDVPGYMMTFNAGKIIELDPPYTHILDDGTLIICQGMGIYHEVEQNNYEIVK